MEKHLVSVWFRNADGDMFEELRCISCTQMTKSLNMLLPTSNSISEHIQWVFVVIRELLILLCPNHSKLNPVDKSQEEVGRFLLPAKCLRSKLEGVIALWTVKLASQMCGGARRFFPASVKRNVKMNLYFSPNGLDESEYTET